MSSKKKKFYYTYFLSDKEHMGVVTDWSYCQKIIQGAAHQIKKHSSYQEALNWLGELVNEQKSSVNKKVQADVLFQKYLYFDSGTGRKKGVEVALSNEKGDSVLSDIIDEKFLTEFNTYRIPLEKKATNNYGELLACFFALNLALNTNMLYSYIFGDSRLVIDYWSKNRCNKNNLPTDTVKLIERVSILRKKFEKQRGQILFIDGDNNLADLGFHK